jgi:hypothetical protein
MASPWVSPRSLSLIHHPKEWKQALNKYDALWWAMESADSALTSLYTQHLRNLLEGSLLVQIRFPILLVPDGTFPSAFLPQILCKLSSSNVGQFRPEDGGSMFLQNLGIDLQNHMAPKLKSAPTSYSVLFSCGIEP